MVVRTLSIAQLREARKAWRCARQDIELEEQCAGQGIEQIRAVLKLEQCARQRTA